MEHIEWNANYATGIPEIDAQHSYLFELTNRFIRGLASPTPQMSPSDLLRELADYAQKHFAFEEQCMKESAYQHLEEHTKSHERLRQQIEQYAEELKRGTLRAQELADFLRNWLVLHILREDMRYIPSVTGAKGDQHGNA